MVVVHFLNALYLIAFIAKTKPFVPFVTSNSISSLHKMENVKNVKFKTVLSVKIHPFAFNASFQIIFTGWDKMVNAFLYFHNVILPTG